MNHKDRKPQKHLINILKATEDHHPNFALFLGAGASVTSGVKMASNMIKEWCDVCHSMYSEGQDLSQYLEAQSWNDSSDKYSILFEMLYDQPSQRREYIESCVKNAKPSWGYIYLVNLLKNSVFNTVFTTNFDDLLNEACYQFSNDVRPIVCAHDSSIRSIRITSNRPKIIKLHGDFLFDNIKNTISELETLEDNMKEKFKQFASEFGLIFVGYSGNDRSVMDTLNLLLKSESNFPHGIYWCVRKGSQINRNVDLLSRFPKFKIIEIEGFDEFFADIHSSLDLELQRELSDPYGTLVERLNKLIENTNIPEPTPGKISPIQKDIELIGQKISMFSRSITIDPINPELVSSIPISYGDGQIDIPVPFKLLSDLQNRSGKFEQSLKYLLRELEIRPNLATFKEAFSLIASKGLSAYGTELMKQFKNSREVLSKEPEETTAIALELINAEMYDLAADVLNLGIDVARKSGRLDSSFTDLHTLNIGQIKAHKNLEFDAEEKAKLEDMAESDNEFFKMGACILLKKYGDAEVLLSQLILEERLRKKTANEWPIFRLLKPHLKDQSLLTISPIDSDSSPLQVDE